MDGVGRHGAVDRLVRALTGVGAAVCVHAALSACHRNVTGELVRDIAHVCVCVRARPALAQHNVLV